MAVLPPDFDSDTYLRLNPDIQLGHLDPAAHYVRFGRNERRFYLTSDLTKLPDDFDPDTYLKMHADVAASGIEPRSHYVRYGRPEGRAYRKVPRYFENYATNSALEADYAGSPRVVTFYLPQYHRIAENDEWWGQGFTEWTNVKKARPNYEGHTQPHVPLYRDYYDLSDPSVLRRQARMAREYGIDAFCYYAYWFNGRRVLERPLDGLLADLDIDIEFCVCWANENWTRTWDGKDKDILLAQVHSTDSDRLFILDMMKYLKDHRYMRVDGALMLLVYRVDLIKDAVETARIWREEVRKAGLGELYLCAVQFYNVGDPNDYGFDAAVEFPPHGWLVNDNLPDRPKTILNEEFCGYIFDYGKSIDFALRKPIPSFNWHRCVFPSWDNTARRQNTSHIFADSDVFKFEHWMFEILRQTCLTSKPQNRLVFVNAWNEWGEGAHLEPDEQVGFGYLQALNSALNRNRSAGALLNILSRLRSPGAYSGRDDDETRLVNIFLGQELTLRQLSLQLTKSVLLEA